MATIVETVANGLGFVSMTQTALNGTADTFTYRQGTGQILILRNGTAGALSPTIDGDGGSTVGVDGLGVINVSAGYAVGSISVGAAVAIPLDTIFHYLAGTITINGGNGLTASLLRTK